MSDFGDFAVDHRLFDAGDIAAKLTDRGDFERAPGPIQEESLLMPSSAMG